MSLRTGAAFIKKQSERPMSLAKLSSHRFVYRLHLGIKITHPRQLYLFIMLKFGLFHHFVHLPKNPRLQAKPLKLWFDAHDSDTRPVDLFLFLQQEKP